MAFLEIRTSAAMNVVIISLGLLLAGFLLLMGVANLIHPDVPAAYLSENTVVCLVICGISLVPLLVVIAAIRGILRNKRSPGREHQT